MSAARASHAADAADAAHASHAALAARAAHAPHASHAADAARAAHASDASRYCCNDHARPLVFNAARSPVVTAAVLRGLRSGRPSASYHANCAVTIAS